MKSVRTPMTTHSPDQWLLLLLDYIHAEMHRHTVSMLYAKLLCSAGKQGQQFHTQH